MSSEFEARLRRAKLDAMKELAYGASHEINNPLANIAARAQTLLRDEQQPDRRRALEAIHLQAMRAHEMISDLMLFARPPALVLERVDLNELITEVTKNLAEECERRQVRLQLKLPEPSQAITGDAQQLSIALTALCTNAVEAIGTDGTIEISVREIEQPAGAVTIDVMDTGPGISDEVRGHLFDPFFSGREAGRGLGFGLSKCWRIVTDHGGTVVVSSEPSEGTTISLQLPKVNAISKA
ncbi:MAG: sensor histidine kinase [Bythopirellula sp.]